MTRNTGNGNLVNAGETWPLLYRDRDRLYNGAFPEGVTYPIAIQANRASGLTGFAPDLEIGHARTWTVGIQRSLSRDMAVDVRYVGTRGVDQWSTLNYNARDVETNGFINEFRNGGGEPEGEQRVAAWPAAPATLATSVRARAPTPCRSIRRISSGRLAMRARSRIPARSGRAPRSRRTWCSSTRARRTRAADLDGDATRRANAIAAGYVPNFFVLNPAVAGNSVTDSGAYSDYHALQIDLRRRLAQGLSASVNYQFATEGGSAFDGFLYGREMVQSENVRHAIKTQWDWTIPVGRGQRYLTDANPWVDGIPRRVVVQGRGPVPDSRGGLRQRPPRGHDEG